MDSTMPRHDRARSPRATSRRARTGVAATLLAALAFGAAPDATAATTVPCTTRATSRPFAAWGDTNDYFAIPNGGFESQLSGWSVNWGSVSVVAGNQTAAAVPGGGTKSLRLQPYSQIQSAVFCTTTNEDSLRFFARNLDGFGTIHVVVDVWTGNRWATAWLYESRTNLTTWRPIPRALVPDARDATGQQLTRITIKTDGGVWQIDDVLVDPWRSR